MVDIGPVEYMVVAFPGNKFRGEIAPAIRDLVESGTVRIIDLAFVTKDQKGTVVAMELEDVDPEVGAAFGQFGADIGDLVNEADLYAVGEELEPNTTAAVLVWEDTWATRLTSAIRAADGVLLDLERVPRDVVEEALAYAGVG